MIGQTISHYKILEKLGEGGMGVVYKAQDTKLNRMVALKFLPPHLSASEQDKARFIQEAQAASALNHPNVCTIHDIQYHDSQMFIVMEYVDGQTLNERKGSISLKQAIDIGIQIADGLAAAHEKGIVHRDLKPENIMIRKDGIVQIMDFGLAKLRGVSHLTKEGSTVGTAGYMSPEQVQGLDTDHRSDIFSLGIVLYEMFTGQLPFRGLHETALSYEIVNVDAPPMSSAKPEIDPALDAVVLECLEKDPNERTQSAKQVSIDLKRVKRESSRQRLSRVTAARPAIKSEKAQLPESTMRFGRERIWIFAAILCFLGCVGLGVLYFLRPSVNPQVVRAFFPPSEKERFFMYGNFGGAAAISPDGKRLTYAAVDSAGKKSLYLRDLSSGALQRLDGTEGAIFPFWSADSRSIGFAAHGKLKKIDAAGGSSISLCNAPGFRGGAWNAGGTIVFCPNSGVTSLYRVPSSGGTPAPVTVLDSVRRENSHRWPSFLPDGKHFLYFVRSVTTRGQGEGDAICVASLDGKPGKILVHASSNAVFASGYLLYARGTVLVAQQFDEGAEELRGDAIILADEIVYDQSTSRGLFTASQHGILVYQTGKVKLGDQLVFYDRNGKKGGPVGDVAEYLSPRLSPDGLRVASYIYDIQSHISNIWITDIVKGSKARFTFGSFWEMYPVWSPDGSRILYMANPEGHFNLYQKSSSGAGSEEIILQTDKGKLPDDWSPDGKFVLYEENADLWVLPTNPDGGAKERKPVPFLQSESYEGQARFSPDGRWIAYVSDESGQQEVYMRPFPASGGKRQVSTSGGLYPRWRRDGKELYYITAENVIMVADIALKDATAEVSNVRPLFEVPSSSYDVSGDGKRFLVVAPYESQNQVPLTLVINWDTELKQKLGKQ
jgi:Tol biopolymer transport system component/predicted Ser/Thr protein kinase